MTSSKFFLLRCWPSRFQSEFDNQKGKARFLNLRPRWTKSPKIRKTLWQLTDYAFRFVKWLFCIHPQSKTISKSEGSKPFISFQCFQSFWWSLQKGVFYSNLWWCFIIIYFEAYDSECWWFTRLWRPEVTFSCSWDLPTRPMNFWHSLRIANWFRREFQKVLCCFLNSVWRSFPSSGLSSSQSRKLGTSSSSSRSSWLCPSTYFLSFTLSFRITLSLCKFLPISKFFLSRISSKHTPR